MLLRHTMLFKLQLKIYLGTNVSVVYVKLIENDNLIEDALMLPIAEQYRALLSNLRFDYMDMKQGEADFKHHYKTTAA